MRGTQSSKSRTFDDSRQQRLRRSEAISLTHQRAQIWLLIRWSSVRARRGLLKASAGQVDDSIVTGILCGSTPMTAPLLSARNDLPPALSTDRRERRAGRTPLE